MIERLIPWIKANPGAMFDAQRNLISRNHGEEDDGQRRPLPHRQGKHFLRLRV
jgi:hypothetical protein